MLVRACVCGEALVSLHANAAFALTALSQAVASTASVSLARLLTIYPSHWVVGSAPVCTHPQLRFVCFAAVGNPANCVNGLSTDGGAVAWYLAHQRCGSTGLLLCVCV